jgi:hypothetical protein
MLATNVEGVAAGQAVWITAASALFCCLIMVYSLKIALGLYGGNMRVMPR